jgi:glyoxylase-like metal-dependent hydrolase (beta-lactamase superfamily II)
VQVHAFLCGEDNAFAAVYDPLDSDPGRRVAGPIFFYLVEHPAGNLLFDSGIPPRLAEGSRLSDALGYKVERDDYVVPKLAAVGIEVTEIEHVVASHLHFDHAGGLSEFPHAHVYLHREELAFASDPPIYQAEIYDPADFAGIKSWTFVEDGADLLGDGSIRIVHTPGHTPGHLSLLVETAAGAIVLAADTSYQTSKMRERRLPGILWSPDAIVASWERLESLEREQGARLVFTHDADFRTSPVAGIEYHL